MKPSTGGTCCKSLQAEKARSRSVFVGFGAVDGCQRLYNDVLREKGMWLMCQWCPWPLKVSPKNNK